MQNPINWRHGARYPDPNDVPVTSIESEAFAPGKPEADQHEREQTESLSSESESPTQPAAVGHETPSATDRSLEEELFTLATPPNPTNPRPGTGYVGLKSPNIKVLADGGDPDPKSQDEQRVDSAASEAAPRSTPSGEAEDSRHVDPVLEWYSDSQIAEFVHYTKDCLSARPPRPVTTIYNVTAIAHPHPSPACMMLRKAHRAGLAQLARITHTTEVYTVGAPPPVTQFAGGLGPQWWASKTPAQVLAGPMAEYRDVRNAQKRLDRKTNAKQYRNRYLDDQRRKTEEGERRQQQRLAICDDEDGDVDISDA